MGGKGLGDRTAGPPGWRWLSRGLEEALLRFLAGAVDGGWAVRPRAPRDEASRQSFWFWW